MTDEQANELIIVLQGIIGALGGIEKAIEKLAAEKKPSSSKRGAKS